MRGVYGNSCTAAVSGGVHLKRSEGRCVSELEPASVTFLLYFGGGALVLGLLAIVFWRRRMRLASFVIGTLAMAFWPNLAFFWVSAFFDRKSLHYFVPTFIAFYVFWLAVCAFVWMVRAGVREWRREQAEKRNEQASR